MATEKEVEKIKKTRYSAEDITVLEGLEPVRKRPGMYIGTTGPDGLHHLIVEVFDNARDEAMGGHANDIEIALLPGNRVRIVDNGRGIPVDVHKKTKVSALETVMTTLHAGAKFGGEGYKVSGGLHGVGVSVVNALSVYLRAVVHRDGGVYVQEYSRGKRKAAVKKIGSSKRTGTIITFEPDTEIFEKIEFDWNKVVSHMRQQAYLVKALRITVLDLRGAGKVNADEVFYARELELEAPSMSFYFEGGLLSLVKFYNQYQTPAHKNIFYVEKEVEGVTVEIALQYVDDIAVRLTAFANNTYNAEGGTHVTGFKTALTRTLNSFARKNNIVKESEENFTGDDVLEGLTGVISVKLREVQFEGQTKAKLGSVEARSAVETVFSEAFSSFLEEHPDDARAMVGKVVLALKARKAAKAAKDSVLRKGALEGMTLPGKLADCQSREAEDSELFVVEGDSAGGCFSGDTKIALIDGRNITFKELVEEDKKGKKNYGYTIKDDGSIGVAPITSPRLTKHNAEVIRVVLDNDEEIVCTPDHQFMLRGGDYKEAQYLTSDDSLAPFYRKLSAIGGKITIEGYEMVYDFRKNFWIFTHLLADRYNLENGVYAEGEGCHRHHKDFNKLNNDPSNLVRITKEDHLELHRTHIGKTLHRPEVKEKCTAIKRTSAYKARAREKSLEKRELFSRNAKKQWEDISYKQYITKKFLEFYNSSPEYRRKNAVLLNQAQKKYWGKAENRKMAAERTRIYFENHPEKRAEYSEKAKQQWDNQELKKWRQEMTAKQWTDEFRRKRKETYNSTFLTKALRALYGIYKTDGVIDVEKYNYIRKVTNDKTLIRYDTVRQRFFGGDEKRLQEAVAQYNHRIKKIIPVFANGEIDVYDLEVHGTHNFALASGVFVHNSAKMGRDRRIQAILPLRGKILNIERARLDKMLASEQIKNLVIAMGTAIGDVFNLEKLRYHKIIIATDADVDGAHIRTLLLTLFYRHFRPVIDGGFLYIAQPPLFKIKKGKEIFYAYSDEQKTKIVGKEEIIEEGEEISEEEAAEDTGAKKQAKISIQRYKGLGEMNAEELWETTMDPARRILKQVTIEDAQDADRIFNVLMGTDVASRKSFIQSNAKYANLDI